jgi:hypothetical protein
MTWRMWDIFASWTWCDVESHRRDLGCELGSTNFRSVAWLLGIYTCILNMRDCETSPDHISEYAKRYSGDDYECAHAWDVDRAGSAADLMLALAQRRVDRHRCDNMMILTCIILPASFIALVSKPI